MESHAKLLDAFDPADADRLLATVVAFDIIALIQKDPSWFQLSLWMIAAGTIGRLCAAVFGLLNWFIIPGGTGAKGIGLWHGGLNVVVLFLFAESWLLRRNAPEPPAMALVLSFCAIVLALVSGWLGRELEDGLGVGGDNGAHFNAPGSFSDRP